MRASSADAAQGADGLDLMVTVSRSTLNQRRQPAAVDPALAVQAARVRAHEQVVGPFGVAEGRRGRRGA